MEEELQEQELEDHLYSMIHHVDETQPNVIAALDNVQAEPVETTPRSNIRRYWRSNNDRNISNESTQRQIAPQSKPITKDPRPKEEKTESNKVSVVDLSIFNPPCITKRIIEIEDHNIHNSVILESSDEDEVVEIALPPKPTITIESSDEDEILIITKPESPSKDQAKSIQVPSSNGDRESASPVPSVVSSVSDDFIRSDCIALNISSRHADDHSFDFSLHGSDLLGQKNSKKRRKRKSKESVATSTPVADKSKNIEDDECFATPKSKAKQKKQKTKSYVVTEKSVPNADVYDSDSNQSINNVKSCGNSFVVSMTSLPNADVYESDSNNSETIKDITQPANNAAKDPDSSDSSIYQEDKTTEPQEETSKSSKNNKNNDSDIVDLTENEYVTLDTSDFDISENIIMANVTGFKESSDYEDEPETEHEPTSVDDSPNYGSTKIPSILYDNLDFDNLKGNDSVCKRRKYSLTSLRADMQKFYNESWGGEDFNHREIQKHMSKDKSLWMIDPKDKMPGQPRRKMACNYCNRTGHRDDTCRMKPAVCYMCGSTGHFEPRCPSKICVNCGAPNHMYSTMCRNCNYWNRIKCAECGQNGHPASHCPDTWRRYHNTVEVVTPLEENRQMKKNHQLYCSGCTRRGHLVHSCRFTIPFSVLPINSPYVSEYRPLYLPSDADKSTPNNNQKNKQCNRKSLESVTLSPTVNCKNDRNKRQSKSPISIETSIKKKKHNSLSEGSESNIIKNPLNNRGPRKISQGNVEINRTEPLPDFIPLSSTNCDKRGQMIQDNEVSDTSDVITSARIYITNNVTEKLKLKDGQEWLDEMIKKCHVTVENSDMNMFLTIKGNIENQESFQAELRDWIASKENQNTDKEPTHERENDNSLMNNIPKNRNNVLRTITKALESLQDDLGDPMAIYKEFTFLQQRHQQLLKQKMVNPMQLSNNRDNMKGMLKKLNMVLLGQAGLADGPKHLNELIIIQEKLTKLRQKTITPEMRKQIGQHYHCIFTAAERTDYSELLQKYFDARNSKSYSKKHNKNKFRVKRKVFVNNTESDSAEKSLKEYVTMPTANIDNERLIKTVMDLGNYHKKLVEVRTNNSDLKKKKNDLMRKLNCYMDTIYKNDHMSMKTIKKVKKTQMQIVMFLNNL